LGACAGAAAAPLRENSEVLLKYQIRAPPPITATKVKKTSRMPRQDFMAMDWKGRLRLAFDAGGEGAVGLVAEGQGVAG
jgi:hypothetical protein